MNLKMKQISRILILLFITLNSFSQEITKIDQFEFVKGDLGGVWEALREFRGIPVWEKVEIPHCYNAEDAVDPDKPYYQGVAWYRTNLKVSEKFGKKRVLLRFGATGQKARVFLYNKLVGSHVGGYDSWSIDITETVRSLYSSPQYKKLIKSGIPLIVRVDNSRDINTIPSDMSDFNIYGGIYRDVSLELKSPNYIKHAYLTPELDRKLKNGKIKVDVLSTLPDKSKLSIELYSPKGELVLSKTVDHKLKSELALNVKKPMLWSPDSPNLYKCKLKVAYENYIDEKIINVGFRKFEFKEKGPFILNGKKLLIRGTHRHEDHAGYGAAQPDNLLRKEFQMMKEMGVNFVRLGHYPQSDLVLHLADSLGMMIWEEIPWCRGGLGDDEFKRKARVQLRNMIQQHYNHPSVIIWGMGNENDWGGDFETFDKDAIRDFLVELHDYTHELDSTRVTGIRRCKFAPHSVDVYSPSIWAGWYRGKFTEYKKVSWEEAQKVKHFIHMEWGGSSHAGRHAENPDKGLEYVKTGRGADESNIAATNKGGEARVSKDGDWSETYICNLFDWHLMEQEDMPWLTGAASWIFKDYSTPIRPENPIPYVNQKGVVQRDLTPKESYYIFQSYWTQKPMIHIYGHTFPVRWGGADEEKLLKVYSNCKKAELFLNGESLGSKKRNVKVYPAAGLSWRTKLRSGNNTLVAVGKRGKEVVKDTISFYYETREWGEPFKIAIQLAETKDRDINEIKVKILDKNGVICLDSKQFVRFEYLGSGKLLDNLGTQKGSRRIGAQNGQASILVKPGAGENAIRVTVEGLGSKMMMW